MQSQRQSQLHLTMMMMMLLLLLLSQASARTLESPKPWHRCRHRLLLLLLLLLLFLLHPAAFRRLCEPWSSGPPAQTAESACWWTLWDLEKLAALQRLQKNALPASLNFSRKSLILSLNMS